VARIRKEKHAAPLHEVQTLAGYTARPLDIAERQYSLGLGKSGFSNHCPGKFKERIGWRDVGGGEQRITWSICKRNRQSRQRSKNKKKFRVDEISRDKKSMCRAWDKKKLIPAEQGGEVPKGWS